MELSEIVHQMEAIAEAYEVANDPDGSTIVIRRDGQLSYLLRPLRGLKFASIEVLKQTAPGEWLGKLASEIGDLRGEGLQERLTNEAEARDATVVGMVKDDLARVGRLIELELLGRKLERRLATQKGG